MSSSATRNWYNRLILPALWGGFRILSPAVGKIREGLRGREGLMERVRQFRETAGGRRVILFHCASAGELEALKPIALELDRSRVAVAVSHFSPSARSALKQSTEFDFADFSPADLRRDVAEYLDQLRPSIIAITKHDIWPNFVWTAHDAGIPLFLINGNFHHQSLRLAPGLRQFHRDFYAVFSEILTVSEEDAQQARRIVGDRVPVRAEGDSRYDRVAMRIAQRRPLPPGVQEMAVGRRVLIAGSTHTDDERLLFPVFKRIAEADQRALLVIVPHDPSPRARDRLRDFCAQFSLSAADADDRPQPGAAQVLIINRTGVLADLYRAGHAAFVGGGFGKGVHSVLEPMAAGLPVVCGPNIFVSHEARLGKQLGIVRVVRKIGETHDILSDWLNEQPDGSPIRERVRAFIAQHTGASSRLAARLMEALGEPA